MIRQKISLVERIIKKLEMVNNRLEAHIQKTNTLLDQMNIADLNTKKLY